MERHGFVIKKLRVQMVRDQMLGPLYRENKDLVVYRRGIRLAEPLTADQLFRLTTRRVSGGKKFLLANSCRLEAISDGVRAVGEVSLADQDKSCQTGHPDRHHVDNGSY